MAWVRFNVCHISKAPDENGVRADRWQVVKNQSGGKADRASPEYLTKQEAEAEAARLREVENA